MFDKKILIVRCLSTLQTPNSISSYALSFLDIFSVSRISLGLRRTPCSANFCVSPFWNEARSSPLLSFFMIIFHSSRSCALGAMNLTCSSTIFNGYRQNIVSTFCFMTFDWVPCVERGCLAPVLDFDLMISNGPVVVKLNVMSALVSFEKVSFYITLGASSSTTDHFFIVICLPPSIFTDLSSES